MFVVEAIGDHIVEAIGGHIVVAYSSIGFAMSLYIESNVSLCFVAFR